MRASPGRSRIAAAVVALVTACAPRPESGPAPDAGSGGAARGPRTGSGTTERGLRVSVSATSAPAGAPIDLTLEVANETDAEIVLDFADGQRFDFEAIADGAPVWRWAADMFFPQMLGQERLPPGESIEWSARLEAGLPTGSYTLRGILTTTPPVEVEVPLTIPDATGDPSR